MVKWTLKTKVGLFVIAIVVVIVAGWQFYKYRFIDKKIGKSLTEKTKGLYRIHYDQIMLDETAGTLRVRNIEIMPDTAVYRRMAGQGTNPAVLVRASIPALDVLGVKTPKALLNKEVEGRKIVISRPTIELSIGKAAKDATAEDPEADITKELLRKLLKVQVDSVELLGADVTIRDIRSGREMLKGSDLSCRLTGLLIDSNTVRDTTRILFARDMDMSCGEIRFPSRNNMYAFRMGSLRYQSHDNTLTIGRVKVEPELSETPFVRSFPVQKDRYDFLMEDVRLVNIDRGGLWRVRIAADSLVVGRSSFRIYRDISRPPDTSSKVGKYPQQLLMRVPVGLNIRKLVFDRAFIEYKEKNGRSGKAGRLQFASAGAVISNVTNMRPAIARDNICKISFHARLLDRAPISAQLDLLLRDRRGRFSVEGNLGPINAVSLNVLTQPMALARLEKGNIRRLYFKISGSDSAADGKVVLLYDGLKVSMLKKGKDGDGYDKKGLASLVANVVIKNSNPGAGKEPRTADVHFERLLNKSFFNLIWKTIFAGIKETVK